MLVWPSSLHPVAFAGLTLAAVAGGVLLWRRLRQRFSARDAVWLLVPKTVALACVVLALAEPAWRRETPLTSESRFLIAVDDSPSMGVMDGSESRFARAARLAGKIRAALPASCRVDTLAFDTTFKPFPDKTAAVAAGTGTDLAGCLRSLAGQADPPAGIVLLTDGGDESVEGLPLPAAPLFIAGIGTGSRDLPDVAIDEVQCPAEVESGVAFDLSVDLRVQGAAKAEFAGSLTRLPVTLAMETPSGRKKLAENTVNLSRGRARTTFKVMAPDQGPMPLAVVVQALPGELSALNNSRPITVEVRRRSLHVLFFTRELGADFKLLRQELGRDPGVTLTALYRTMGERFTLQGERLPGDEELEAGFPDNPKTLALYNVVILGAFPASDWTPAGMTALAAYVDGGGSVLFLGGEHAFGGGGYAGTPLEPLLPWQIRPDEPELQTGRFPVSITRESAAHPVVAGLEPLFAQERDVSVESLNRPGPKRPAAETLLQAPAGGDTVALLTVQPYGKGRTGALASNTLWKWARRSQPLGDAYGLLLRQWVRWAAGEAEGGRLLAVRWERARYRPGEEAAASITLAGRDTAGATVTASVTGPDGRTAPLAVEAQPGMNDAFRLRVPFTSRGTYTAAITAAKQGVTLETVSKTWPVAPFLPEGARLVPDEAWLARLAERSGGVYVPESDAESLVARVRHAAVSRTVTTETPIAQTGPWLALIFFGALLLEWVQRRRHNLI
jgi:uncharacterized membrane protein